MRVLPFVILLSLASSVTMADSHRESVNLAARGEGYIGFSTLEIGSIDEEAFQGGGAVSAALNVESFYFQADFFGDKTDYDGVESSVVGVGGHAGWRDAERGSAGITAVYNDQEVESLDIDVWRVGFEGEVFIDRVSLAANLGYVEVEIANAEGDSFYLDGGLSYYPVDPLRLALGGGVVDPENGDAIGLLNMSAEYFVANPISAFARWEASFLDSGSTEIDQHSLVFGVRLYWGGEDTRLIDYDRAHLKETCTGFLLLGRVC